MAPEVGNGGERPRVVLRVVPPPPPEPPARPPFPWRDLLIGGVLVVCLLLLGRQILIQGVADSLADRSPDAALAWMPHHPGALARRAERTLAVRMDPRAAARDAREALQLSPMQGSAFRSLATVAGMEGDLRAERRLMTIAGDRMKRDIAANTWLIEDRLRGGQLAEAAERSDGLMRAWPVSLRRKVGDSLIELATLPGGAVTLARLLDNDPPWRAAFLNDVARFGDNPGAAMALYTAMSAGRRPPSEAETGALVNRLIKEGLHQEAFLVWAQLLPPEGIRNLADPYDGGFDGLPGVAPFNWQFVDKGGVLVEPARDGDNRVLYLRFTDGLPPAFLARQLLVLPEGRHRLTGRWKSRGISAARPLVWRFACAEQRGPVIGQTAPMAGRTDWKTFEADITVPAGCRAQWLVLTAVGRGQIDGEAWFDDLKISRAG